MSRVYFHSPSGDAELRGSERAWLGRLVDDIGVSLLVIDSLDDVDRLRALITQDRYLSNEGITEPGWLSSWAEHFRMTFGRFGRSLLAYQGRVVSSSDFVANTALAVGSDPIKLAARIDGSCELHAWVDVPNRAWLADIMQGGLDAGIYRKGLQYKPEPDGTPGPWVDQGWGEVIALLRTRNDEPVVMSYSACESFPYEIALSEYADRIDDWYDLLDDAERWEIGMTALRASEDGLELKPDNWSDFRFGHKLTALDLQADDWEARVRVALGLEPADTESEAVR